MPHLLAGLLTVVMLLGPTVARAQSSPDADAAAELETEARARFSLGQLYYSQARFEEAALEFEAAYASHPHPLLLHNIYLARRDLGDFRGAVDALTRYLHDATDLSAAERRLLEGRLAAMERTLPSTPVDDPVVGDTEPVDTGEALADPTIGVASPTPVHDDGPMTGAIVSFSVAGAAVLMMAITGPLALTERDNLAATCSPTCTDAQVSTARTLGIVTDVGLGVAGAAAIAGVALAVVASLQGDATVAVAPSVSSDHAALIVGGSF